VTLIDTNVLLDLVTGDTHWASWSLSQLDAAALRGPLLVNDIVYAELSVRFLTLEAVDGFLERAGVTWAAMPRPALFLAGKVFRRYRENGGRRAGVLPDFFVGAHAAVRGFTLLSRDAQRFRTYFPGLDLITP
jgi:predicted nucleic acid-binding protein